MLKLIAVALIVLVAALLIFAATKPNSFRIQRVASIKAPPDKIFALINDFHRWGVWSPYEKIDPAMKRDFGGAPSGKGATYAWEGNDKAGKGHMEILDATPGARVLIKLDFDKPFEAHNTADFTMEPKGEITEVTWAMYGPQPFISKLMGVFFNMDKMIGKDFETGLANMKTAAEQ